MFKEEFVFDLQRFVTINNGASNTLVSGTSGNDSIYNAMGESVSIDAGAGNDTIYNGGGHYASINAGDGNDSINNAISLYASINAGDGNDSISNSSEKVTLDAGAGDDYIYNRGGYYASIDGSAGNDSIYNLAYNITINTGEGNDSIYNDYNSSNASINAGDGNDTIENIAGYRVTITSGAGNDSISNTGASVSVDAGDGKDSIRNQGSNVSINGGDGDDTIYSDGSNDTITAGADDDLIDNYGSNVSINGGDGDDTIYNTGHWDSSKYVGADNVTINAGDGKDYISNYGSNDTINAGAGDDSIDNYGSNVSISAGDGNDSINNSGASVSVDAGDGNDSIGNSGASVSVDAGAGDDSIYGCSKDSKVDGGDGDDYIEHVAGTGRYWGNNTLYGGAGNDTISNDCDNVTIDGGEGDDHITNGNAGAGGYSHGDNVSINGSDGNNWIWNHGLYVTIKTGSGADNIWTERSNILIDTGAGNDNIDNDSTNSTINAGDGDDFIQAGESSTVYAGAGNDSILVVKTNNFIFAQEGDDSITIAQEANGIFVDAGAGSDTISNSGSKVTIDSGAGSDEVVNFGDNVLFDGGGGHDWIQNSGNYSTLSGGAGNDYINNSGGWSVTNVTIDGGADNDSISNSYSLVSISGGAGDDSISNFSPDVTISAGTGNDTIYNHSAGENVLFQYASGDGNDLICGFNEDDTLSITGGTYSADFVGDDLIVTVGKGKITLAGAASLESVNINDEKIFSYSWTLDGTVATYGSASKTLLTVSGVKSLNGISLSGKVVTVSKAALNATDISVSDGYTLALASDVPAPTTAKATYSDGVYKTAGVSKAGYQLSGNSIRYVTADIKTIKFSGVADDVTASNFYVSGNTITVGKAAVKTDGTALKLLTSGYTLKLGNGMAAPTTSKAWTLKNSAATYRQTTSAGYSLADNAIAYTDAATKNLITVSGVKSLDGLKLSKKVVTVSSASLGTKDVSISDGYTLALGSDVSKPSTSKAWSLDGTTATYQQTTTAGYKLADNAITYSKAATKNLITVSGVKSLDGLKLSKKIVTVSAASLGTKDVSISDGYTLKLGSDVSKPSTSKAWSLDGTTAAYQQTTSAGYTLADNAISYSKAATKNLITVSGVADDATVKNFYLSGTSITVGKAAVKTDGTALKLLTSGYTLKLGNGMAAPTTSKAWSLDGTTAAYQQTTTAGYKLADNSITYSKAATKNLITVSGVSADATASNFYLSGNSITVGKAAVKTDGTALKLLTSGYTLKLGNGMAAPTTSKAWSLDGTTAAYQQTTSAGYKLADNAITYSKKSSKTLVTVDGVDSLDGLKLSKKVVTVSSASLGTSDVTISDGYKLKLGKDVDAPTSKQAAWTLKKTTATYKSSSTTAGYTLEDNVIRYSKKKSASTLATIKGVENVDGLSISGKMISAEATALSKKVTVSSDDYGFDFGTDYKKARVTGSEFDDKIKSAGQRVTIFGGAGDDSLVGSGKYSYLSGGEGKDTIISGGNGSTLNGGAGNDLLTGSGEEDIFVYAAGDGNDTITNYDTSDKISLASGAAKISVSLGAVVFKVGSGKLTLKNAADLKVTYIDADGTEHTYPEEQNPVEFNAKGTGATLTTAYTDETFDINGYRDYKDSVVTINASAVLHPLDITGNNLANVITGTSEDDYIYGEDGGDKIFGGDGNDSLWGGAGNDTLTGDSGSDVFIFYDGDGDDLITDYESDIDTVMIMSGTVSNPIVDGRDVYFSVGDGQITFEDAASKPIVLVNRNGKQVGSHTPK